MRKYLIIIILLITTLGCHSTKETLKNETQTITNKSWDLIELYGDPIDATGDPHFIIQTENNRVTGNGGCNSFSCDYQLQENNKISFSSVISTKKYCINIQYETSFFDALQQTENYTLNGDTLTLNNAEMQLLARFIYHSSR